MHEETANPSQTVPDHGPHLELGARLRELRKAKGLTLAEVAEKSKLAISTISRAERGLLALTYDKLIKVADGLDVDFSALFRQSGKNVGASELSVARVGDVEVQETDTYRYEILFPDIWNKGMTPMTGLVKARTTAEFPDFIRHPGQEFVFVLSGSLVVHSENNPPIILSPGESVYFDSSMGHVYTKAGDEDCRILVVCLPAR